MRSGEYFENRRVSDKKKGINMTERFLLRELKMSYKEALTEIKKEIEKLYESITKENKISLYEAKKKLSNVDFKNINFEEIANYAAKENDKFRLAEEYMSNDTFLLIIKERDNFEKLLKMYSKRGYITHLELMGLHIENIVMKLKEKEQINLIDLLIKSYEDGYFRNIYSMQKGFDITFDFAMPSTEDVKKAVLTSWSKMHFSRRIWKEQKNLGQTLKKALTTGTIRGESIEKITKRLTDRLDVSHSNARRLVRTETARIHESATLDSYEECGITKYQFLATLDRKTSEVCRKSDLKVYECKDAKPGINMPPLHPNCRSTTVPYFDDEKIAKRAARNADGTYVTVPSNLSYEEWYKGLKKAEKVKMETLNKYDRYRSEDRKQLNEISKIIGEKETPSLEKYQEMKYNGNEEYRLFKGYISSVSKGEISPFVGREQFNRTAEELRNLIGTTTSDGVLITGFSTHMVARVIGQHGAMDEGKKGMRKGVTVAMVQEALECKSDDIRMDKLGRISRRYIGKWCVVSVNTHTGSLVQAQPNR